MTPANEVLGGFGVTVEFMDEHAVLGIRGELDLCTAPRLGAFFDAVIASGCRFAVVDLAKLAFTDVTGMRVIAFAARRLAASGGGLTIRSPSAMFGRLLALTGWAEVINLEWPEPDTHRLGREQMPKLGSTPHPLSSPALTQYLWRVAAVPADDEVVDAALRLVVALARATVGGADGVSVSLRRRGRLATVAASDETISEMDANQYATGEGPCVDASVEGRWFHAESLDTETRWAAFTPRARALGINAILSSPLLAEDRPVGALNIYSRSVAAFAPKDQELASLFAAEASTVLTSAGLDVTDDQLSGSIGQSLRVRQIIALAQGVLMEREGVGEDDAYTALRDFSQRTDRPLRERAEDVVASTERFWLDGGPEAVDGQDG